MYSPNKYIYVLYTCLMIGQRIVIFFLLFVLVLIFYYRLGYNDIFLFNSLLLCYDLYDDLLCIKYMKWGWKI